jgi:hypothetical protein
MISRIRYAKMYKKKLIMKIFAVIVQCDKFQVCLELFRIPGRSDTYVDAVCSYANPQTHADCESTAGKVAEKNLSLPVYPV